MRLKPHDHLDIFYRSAFINLLSVLLISYIFILPVASWYKLIIVLLWSILVTIFDRLEGYVDYSNNKALERLLFNHLTLRHAADEIVLNMHRSGYCIDWESVASKALEDIGNADEQFKLEEQLGGSKAIMAIIYVIFMPLWFLFWPILGWLLAYSLQRYAPDFTASLISLSEKLVLMPGTPF